LFLRLFRIFGIIALCTLAAIIGFLYYAGFFDPVVLSVEKQGPFQLIYREYRGSYRGVRFIINDVYRYVHDSLHVATDTGFAVFYDTPGETGDDNLRSVSGIITGSDKTVRSPYKKGVMSRADAIVGRCYLRSFFSYMTGSFKFYADLSKFAEKKGLKQNGPAVEMYDMVHRSIVYIVPCNSGAAPVPAFSGK
jgi:hypothetical protein